MADKQKSNKSKTKTQTEENDKLEAKNEPDTRKDRKKSNTGLLFGIIGFVLAFALIILAVIAFRKAPNPSDPKASPTYSSSFFIYNDGKYTLWDSEGKRLTDDEYDDKSSFIGGYAYVRKGSEYALINDRGKIMLNYGQISAIDDYGAGLYVINDNSGAQHLMLGNGKVLLSGDELDLDYSSNTATFGSVKRDNTYYVFNYAGIKMAEIEAVDEETMRFASSDDFGLVYYNGWNLIFDNRSGKQVAMFEGKRFTFDTISEDRSTILLNEYEDSEEYKIIRNGKVYDLNETKNYGMIRDADWIIGYDDYDEVSLLDSNYKVTKKVNSDIAIKDVDNYAVMNDDGVVEIYYRGNSVKKFENDAEIASGVLLYADLYAIKDDGKYAFYHLDGSLAFGEYEDVYSLFDKNHHASVSENGEDYYLIDTNGNKVNDITYRRIYTYEHSYVVYDKDSKRAILAENGSPVTGFDYTEAYNRSSAIDHEIWSLKREANSYDVIDVTAPTDKRVLVTNVNVYDFYSSYFTVKNDDGGYDYYTYKGTLFFRTTKK